VRPTQPLREGVRLPETTHLQRLLYFLGPSWQYSGGSALIGWVKEDAEFIAQQIAAYQESKARASALAPVASARARATERM
jgi:hypothetical protein